MNDEALNLELRNAIKYALVALGAFAIGSLTALVPVLMDPSQDPINFRPIIAAGISSVLSALGAMQLPRAGSAPLAACVNALQSAGYQKRDLEVLPKRSARPRGITDPVAVETPPVARPPEDALDDALSREQRP